MLRNLRKIKEKISLLSANQIIKGIKEKKLTYLSVKALSDINEVVENIEKSNTPGILVEAGCALGGSSILIGNFKSQERKFMVFDTFEMIPPPTEKDDKDVHDRFKVIKSGEAQGIDGNTYYGYVENLHKQVELSFNEFGMDLKENNIELVKGLFQDTMKFDQKIAFAHIDCDWYDSVYYCLEQIVPNLSDGGTLVLDDYYSWSGCRKAVDDFFEKNGKEHLTFVKKDRLHINKNIK